jgi:hypothetical protein
LELAGALKSGAGDTSKSASEMTAQELDARLAALTQPDTQTPSRS